MNSYEMASLLPKFASPNTINANGDHLLRYDYKSAFTDLVSEGHTDWNSEIGEIY